MKNMRFETESVKSEVNEKGEGPNSLCEQIIWVLDDRLEARMDEFDQRLKNKLSTTKFIHQRHRKKGKMWLSWQKAVTFRT